MDIKILVAMHKPYASPDDDVYMPIQVGADLHESFGILGDNTGKNISNKNPNYCELTAIYWAWKNLEADYVGLCHYRRYFGHKSFFKKASLEDTLCRDEYESLLKKYDCIVPTKRNYYIETVRSHYEHAHYKKDLDEVESIIKEHFPEYEASFSKVMNSRSLYICNMFVMKKKDFHAYCEFLFDLLFELEKRIDISHYSLYDARIYGFLSERLFNVWLMKHIEINRKEIPIIQLEPINWVKKIYSFFKRKL